MTNEKRFLITQSGCPVCPSAKKALRAKGIKFKEINADTKEGAKLADELGIEFVPTAVLQKGSKMKKLRNWTQLLEK